MPNAPYRQDSAHQQCVGCGCGLVNENASMTDQGWMCPGCFAQWETARDARYEKKLGLSSHYHSWWRSTTWRSAKVLMWALLVVTSLIAAGSRMTRYRRIAGELEPGKYESTWPYAPKEQDKPRLHRCPFCGKAQPFAEGAACRQCMELTADQSGRLVYFLSEVGEGCVSRYRDTFGRSPGGCAGCYINGARCRVDESRVESGVFVRVTPR